MGSAAVFDVIVVGARCAGATLAAYLARAGMRTLLLEADERGSDMPMSTHFVQAPGMDVLDHLGVGARVREATPPIAQLRLGLEDTVLTVAAPRGREGYCVRRKTLDPWLQEAAVEAGADLRDRHRVVSLVKRSERVVGVVAETPQGRRTFYSDLVVGADGPRSLVARLSAVEAYLVSHSVRGGYWGYYPAPAGWKATWDGAMEHHGHEHRFAFRSDGGLLMLAFVARADEVRAGAGRAAERLHAALLASPTTRSLVEGRQAIGKVHGLFEASSFYRRPIGPGYALVGDAGHVSNYAAAQGMTEALLDAQRLARAVLRGGAAAYQYYWRERDAATLPLHFDAERKGDERYNDPFMRWAFARIARDPKLVARLPLVLDRKLDPDAVLPAHKLLVWMMTALVGRRWDVLSGLLRTGRALSREQQELRRRRSLLESAARALAFSAIKPERVLET